MAIEFIPVSEFKEIHDKIRETGIKKYFIKVSTKTCPPCKTLKQFLEEYDTSLVKNMADSKTPIICFNVDAGEQPPIFKALQFEHNIMGVPFLGLFTDENRLITEMRGFSATEKQRLEGLLETFYTATVPELEFK